MPAMYLVFYSLFCCFLFVFVFFSVFLFSLYATVSLWQPQFQFQCASVRKLGAMIVSKWQSEFLFFFLFCFVLCDRLKQKTKNSKENRERMKKYWPMYHKNTGSKCNKQWQPSIKEMPCKTHLHSHTLYNCTLHTQYNYGGIYFSFFLLI